MSGTSPTAEGETMHALTHRAVFGEQAKSASKVAASSLHLMLSLVFNTQLIPLLAFLLVGSLWLLLRIFFNHVVPHILARSLPGVCGGSVLLGAAVVTVALVLRSYAYLATDPFAATEHALFLKAVIRVGLVRVVVIAVALIAASVYFARGFDAPAGSATEQLVMFSRAVAFCAAAQVGVMLVFALLLDVRTLLHDVRVAVVLVAERTAGGARLRPSGRKRMVLRRPLVADRTIDALTAAWSTLLASGKVVGLVAAVVIALRRDPALTGSASTSESLIVLLFGQVLCFAGLWMALEVYQLAGVAFRIVGAGWRGVAKVCGVAVAAACVAAAEGSILLSVVLVPAGALLLAAYWEHMGRRARRARAAAQAGKTTGEWPSGVMVVTAIIRVSVGLILAAVAALLLYTAYQGWMQPAIDDVYTIEVDGSMAAGGVFALTHEGFGEAQSRTELRMVPGSEADRNTMENVCSLEWKGLNLFDVGLMAQFVYLNPGTVHLERTLQALYEPAGWTVTFPPRDEAQHVWFAEFYSPRRNLAVVAVRGTNPSDLWDVVQDLAIWYPAGMVQAAMALPTTLSLWPTDLLAAHVGLVSLIEDVMDGWEAALFGTGSRAATFYHDPVLEYVQRRRRQLPPGTDFLVTGHSLGGGVAKIVGAISNTTAVSFSGPGLVLSRHRFGLSLDAINRYAVSVIPTHDIVPKIDLHAGLVHHLICKWGDPVLCHDPMVALCSIHASCGSQMFAIDDCSFVAFPDRLSAPDARDAAPDARDAAPDARDAAPDARDAAPDAREL